MLMMGILLAGSTASARVNIGDDGCLACHRLKGLLTVKEEKGEKLIQDNSINPALYMHSIHRDVGCTECHSHVKSYPHDVKAAREVNCAAKCHVIDPSTRRPFSHENIYETWKESVHGKNYAKAPELYPDCQYCHTNREMIDVKKFASLEGSFDRCSLCHQNKQWLSDRLSHVASRMDVPIVKNGFVFQFVRPGIPKVQVVKMCASCHADEEKMKEAIKIEGIHGKYAKLHILEAVPSYEKTMHWKMLVLDPNDQRAADCIDCHTNADGNFHDIFHKTDPRSSINPANIEKTCGRATECHPLAPKYHMKNFATTQWVHMEPFRGESLGQTIVWLVEENMFWMAAFVMVFAAAIVVLDTIRYARRK